MPYFLIKQWTLHRGQTRENPGCFFGPGSCFSELPSIIKSYNCYSNRKRAERVAAKRYSVYSPNEIVELDPSTVRKYVIDKISSTYVPAVGQDDIVSVTFNGTRSEWKRIDAIRHYNSLVMEGYHNDDSTFRAEYFRIISDLCDCRMECSDERKEDYNE